MAKKVFEIVIDTDNLDPRDRCYYDFVDWPIDSRASEEEVDSALAEILAGMSEEDKTFGTSFHKWFYNAKPKAYDMMCDILWDAIDEYVQDELTKRFKED